MGNWAFDRKSSAGKTGVVGASAPDAHDGGGTRRRMGEISCGAWRYFSEAAAGDAGRNPVYLFRAGLVADSDCAAMVGSVARSWFALRSDGFGFARSAEDQAGQAGSHSAAYRGEARGEAEGDLGIAIGVSGPKIIWRRVIALSAALCVSWNCTFLGPAFVGMFSRAIRGDFENYSGILAWQIHEYFGRGASIANLEMPLLLAACICVAFRYIRNWKSGTLATAAGFLMVFELTERLSSHGEFYFAGALSTFVFQLGFVGGLAFSVPRFKPIAKGLFLGAYFGDVAAWMALFLLGGILSQRLVEPYAPIYYAFNEAVFAFVFWMILRVGARAKN